MVNVHDAKTHFSKLLDQAHAGEEIIIAKNGQPYARLVPLDAPRPRPLGLLANSRFDASRFNEPLSEHELRAWEGEYGSTP